MRISKVSNPVNLMILLGSCCSSLGSTMKDINVQGIKIVSQAYMFVRHKDLLYAMWFQYKKSMVCNALSVYIIAYLKAEYEVILESTVWFILAE